MGLGKWVVSSMCAAGAVIAAPVILPTAGISLLAAGVVGATAGSIYERQMDKARDEGRRESIISVSNTYEEKMRDQEQNFKAKIKEYMYIINKLKGKLKKYKEKVDLTEEELQERDEIEKEMLEYIKKLEEELDGEDSSTTALVSEYISDVRLVLG